MKVKITPYEWFLNVFTLSVLIGMVYLLWALADGFEWYWRLAWVIGLFSLGGLMSWAAANGFGAVPVYIVNLPKNEKNHE